MLYKILWSASSEKSINVTLVLFLYIYHIFSEKRIEK